RCCARDRRIYRSISFHTHRSDRSCQHERQGLPERPGTGSGASTRWRTMRGWLHSTQLQFTRDGAALIAMEPDGVSLVARAGDRRWHVAIAGVQAIAAFADQVWVATRTGTLVRLGLDGRRLDDHVIPIAADGALLPTVIGGAAALWTGGES